MENHIALSIGDLCSLWLLYRVISFIYPYVRLSNLKKYFIENAYALTGGIGKALALELANSGFKIVLHGRNTYKLQAVEKEIKTNSPERDVNYRF